MGDQEICQLSMSAFFSCHWLQHDDGDVFDGKSERPIQMKVGPMMTLVNAVTGLLVWFGVRTNVCLKPLVSVGRVTPPDGSPSIPLSNGHCDRPGPNTNVNARHEGTPCHK